MDIPHQSGSLLGAKFKRGWVYTCLSHGPGHTVICFRHDVREKHQEEKHLLIMPMPTLAEIDASTPVYAHELNPRMF